MGAVIVSPRSKMKIRRIAVAFLDDTSMYSNRTNTQSNMQSILDTYRKLYKAIGESIQSEKKLLLLMDMKSS